MTATSTTTRQTYSRTTDRSVTVPLDASPATTRRRLWRVVGWLSIAHVVLLLAGVSLERSSMLGDSPAKLSAALTQGSMVRDFSGGFIEVVAMLVLLVDAALLARLLRGRGDVSAWWSSCISGSAVAYVAVSIATGFAAGAAAIYDGHHGAPLATVATVTDIRNFAFFLSTAVIGVMTISVAAAARTTRLLPRWVTVSGYVVGFLCIAMTPASRLDLAGSASLLWLVWFVALGVAALRNARATGRITDETA